MLQRLLLRQDCNFQKKGAAIFLQDGSHGIKASENPYRFSEAFLENGFRFRGLFYPEKTGRKCIIRKKIRILRQDGKRRRCGEALRRV